MKGKIMKTHKLITILLSIFIGFNAVGACYGEETDANANSQNVESLVSDDEIGLQNDESEGDDSHNYGAIISEHAEDVPYYESDTETYTAIPSSYVLDKSKYPDVRNQGNYGTCWSFAALGLSEFDLITKGLADKTIDLSELQLAYFTYNSVIDPLGGTVGDQSQYYNGSTDYSYLNRGGMYEYAVRRLSQWSGATNERDVPYNTSNINTVLNNGLSAEYAYSKDVAHLENAYILSLKNNRDDVKNFIMSNGAVGVQYYHSDSKLLWNSDKQLWTYYDSAISGGGHNVMIVGWDDNFSKDDFVGDKPVNNGAWLIRNSWGFTQSYFWMSYENASLLDAAWAFDMNTADNYDNNYQLDGGVDCFNVSNKICQYKTYSNVFTVQSQDTITSEDLKAVSLSFTHVANVNYKIEVYTDLKNTNPYSGTKQESATTEGTTAYAGLYTVPLTSSVQLTPGSSFAIVVTTDKYALDYEQGITWEKNGVKVWDAPVSLNSGKSFYGTGNYQWDWYWGNFCIKAFTTNNHKVQKDISNAVITLNEDFSESNPSITVTYGDVSTLIKDVDYTVSCTTDTNGTTVTIHGQGDYTGTASKTFIPVGKLAIKCKDIAYTGNEVTPAVTVKNGETDLTLNFDYTVSYSNNVNVSEKAIATVKGMGDYYGSVEVPFQIYNDIGEDLTAFSLGLKGLIEFNVYIDLSDQLHNDVNAYVLFTLPDGRATLKQYVKDAAKQEGYGYVFTCGVYAKEITKKVTIQVFNGQGIGGKIYYRSVEDYTNVSLSSDREQSIKVRPLIKALLNYGGYSQNLFQYNLDDMAYKNVQDDMQQAMDQVNVNNLSMYKVVSKGNETGIREMGLALLLESSTSLRYYFTIDSSVDLSKLVIQIDGNDCELKKDANGYYLEMPSIRSKELDKVYTFTVGGMSIQCSALSYVYNSLRNATSPNGMLVAKAIYLYWKESKAYFG